MWLRKHGIDISFDAYKAWHSAHVPTGKSAGHSQFPTNLPAAMPSASMAGKLPDLAFESCRNVSTEPPTPYPVAFAHIVELITTGQPIPGVKDIPNTILEGQATQPTRFKRKKPWEQQADGDALGSMS